MNKEKAVSEVEEFIIKRDNVTLIEIKKLIGSKYGEEAATGDLRIILDNYNVAIGFGLSRFLCDVLTACMQRERVEVRPCSIFVLLADGCMIPRDMELAKRPPKGGYKKTRWSPVVWKPAKTEKK